MIDFKKLDEKNYLAHYGVLGMKWGVRRYQKPDGSLISNLIKRSKSKKKSSKNKLSNKKDNHKDSRSKQAFKRGLKRYAASVGLQSAGLVGGAYATRQLFTGGSAKKAAIGYAVYGSLGIMGFAKGVKSFGDFGRAIYYKVIDDKKKN